jgi:hypothetical protein
MGDACGGEKNDPTNRARTHSVKDTRRRGKSC